MVVCVLVVCTLLDIATSDREKVLQDCKNWFAWQMCNFLHVQCPYTCPLKYMFNAFNTFKNMDGFWTNSSTNSTQLSRNYDTAAVDRWWHSASLAHSNQPCQWGPSAQRFGLTLSKWMKTCLDAIFVREKLHPRGVIPATSPNTWRACIVWS